MSLIDKIFKNIIEKASTPEKNKALWLDSEKTKKAIEEKVKKAVKELNNILESERKTTWEEGEEHSSNPIHQSDFIDMINRIKKIFGKDLT